jgi:Zn-dependent protease
MTFNPLVHMGGMSLILLLMAGIAWGAMPVNPARLRGRYGPALVALAGPASNVILALLALGTLGLLERWDYGDLDNVEAFSSHLRNLLWVFGYTNVALAIFNLLPVPPLDGSRVLANLSAPFAQLMQSMRQGGGAGIVFVLVFLFAGQLIFPAAASVANGFLEFIRGN